MTSMMLPCEKSGGTVRAVRGLHQLIADIITTTAGDDFIQVTSKGAFHSAQTEVLEYRYMVHAIIVLLNK